MRRRPGWLVDVEARAAKLRLRPWAWFVVAALFGVALCFVPLFGVLGFELALVAAAFAAIAGLDVGAAFARAAMRDRAAILERSAYPARTYLVAIARSSGTAVAIALVPAVICAVHGIWAPTCDWPFGIEAYALMPIVTAAFAGAVGHCIAVIVGARDEFRWRPHRSTVLALGVPIVAGVATGFWRFYSEPPVFIYNALIGYFPGNMYDEHIRLGAPLVWSRVEQLAWLVALVAVIVARFDVPTFRFAWRAPRPAEPRRAAAAVALVALAGAVVLHLRANDLGYAIDAADIQAELGGRIETAHFIIHYAKTADIEKDIDVIARDHELRYAEVVAEIGDAPAGKLESYYFANTEQKGRWFGARNVEMAKPWRHEIYLDHRPFPHTSLRHEIAHAVASAFGDRFFGVASRYGVLFSPGLIEGLAVALDWPGGYDRLTPHEAVRVMQVMGVQPTISELLSIGFFAVSPARGYTTAGSFLHFLLERYGAEKLRALYHSGGEFGAVYGRGLAELEREWREMIATIDLAPEVVEGMRERFRGGGVFSRPCPHAIAARRDKAAELATHGDHAGAVDLMRHVCADAPEEPRHRIDLGDMLSLGSGGERDEARAIWTAIANDTTVTPTLRGQALHKLARFAADDAAREPLIKQALALPIEGDDRRQIEAEAFALHHQGPAGVALRTYFFGDPAPGKTLVDLAAAAVAAEPTLGFAHYLLGLQRGNVGEWAASAAELETALQSELPGSAFVRFAARRLAVVAYRAGDRYRVNRAIAVMNAPGMTAVDRLLGDDWAHRLALDATGHL